MTDLREPPTLAPHTPDADVADVADVPRARRRSSRRRETPQHARRRRGLLVTGVAVLLAGLLLLGYLVWQFFGTNWVSQNRQDDVRASIQSSWGQGTAAARTPWGDADALLRIPRFGEDFVVPVVDGTTEEALASGVGHVEDTEDVGEVGNHVLAGHRVTNGEPFADFPELRDGDLVEIETRDAFYTYELDNGGTELTVLFSADWVLEDQPVNPDPLGVSAPTDVGDRLLTLITCSEIFHTDNRSVVFGHLVDRAPKLPGLT